MIIKPLIDNILNPVIVFIPNAVKAKKIENAKIVKVNQYCRIVGLKDWIIFVPVVLVKIISLFTVFYRLLRLSIYHEIHSNVWLQRLLLHSIWVNTLSEFFQKNRGILNWIIGKEVYHVKVNAGQSSVSGHFKKTEKLPLLLMTIKRKD